MRILSLLWILLFCDSPVFAQVNQPASRLDSVPVAAPVAAGADTAAALHRLFAARRKRNFYGLAGTVAFGVTGFFLSGELSGEGIANSRDVARFFIPLLSIPTASVLAVSYALSKKKERQALRNLQGHRLPDRLKYALTREYFNE